MPEFNKVMIHSETGQYMVNIITHLMSVIEADKMNIKILEKAQEIIEFSNNTKLERSRY